MIVNPVKQQYYNNLTSNSY